MKIKQNMSSKDWHEMIIPSGYEHTAHLYDLFDKKKNIEFFYHFAAASAEILDIGAGTGRIAIPLAERGIKVYCIEPSLAMRKEFNNKLAMKKELIERISIIEGDAATFRINKEFPVAILSGSFDHLLSDEERVSALLNIGKHLESNGKLVFDVFLGLMGDSSLEPAGTAHVNDIEYRRYVSTKVLPNHIQETVIVIEEFKAGELVNWIEERSLVGLISKEHLLLLLDKAGFRVKQLFGDYEFSIYWDGDPLLIVEAESK
jgi:SAM-dependent methyltransferase